MCIGVQISALFRNYLNWAGLPWKDCEKFGKIFNKQIEDAIWLSTDRGITFTRTFIPDEFDQEE